MKEQLHIVKIGGNIINDENKLQEALVAFGNLEGPKILVHGGGRSASDLEKKLGIPTNMIDGRRITSRDSLEVVVMTYAGLINKTIVARLQSMGHQSIGLSGADFDIIRSQKRINEHIDYGFVGDIVSVQSRSLVQLLSIGVVPVLCAITHDNEGQLLNTNADTIASKVAQAMVDDYDVHLRYIFEFPGVLKSMDDVTDTFAQLDQVLIDRYTKDGTLSAGMLPKMSNALEARRNGVESVSICAVGNLSSQNQATEILWT